MILIYKDTNTINANQKINSINLLEEIEKNFPEQLAIEKAPILDFELRKNSISNAKRLEKSSYLLETYVTDDNLKLEVLQIIFERRNYRSYTEQEIADADHISTAIFGGGTYFITYDRELLDKSEQIFKRYSSLRICTPEDCLSKVQDRLSISWK